MDGNVTAITQLASRKVKGVVLVVCLCLAAVLFTACIVIVMVVLGRVNVTDKEIHSLTDSDDDKCGGDTMLVETVNGQGRDDGLYFRQTTGVNGRPQYKHESNSAWMYYTSNGEWVLESSEFLIEMLVRSTALRPDNVTGGWKVRSGSMGNMKKMLKVVCVDASFAACHTGKLRVSNCAIKPTYNGFYFVTFAVRHNRPVYQHERGNPYLYHVDQHWCFGNLLNFKSGKGILCARDFASRPEYVVHKWIPYGLPDVEDPLRIRCVNNTRPDPKFFAEPHPRCRVPFSYRSIVYKACTKVDDTKYWCSHTSNSTGNWSYCNPAMTMHDHCVSPFEYKGRNYTGCTNQDSDKYWCSLNHIHMGLFEKCHPRHIEMDASCLETFVNERRRYAGCIKYKSKYFWCSTSKYYSPNARVYCINKGIVPHSACKFPFQYGGRTYYRCAMGENTKPWCSTNRPYNGTWKYCEHYTF